MKSTRLARHQARTFGPQSWLSARSKISVIGQLARMARSSRRRRARISVPFGRLAGRSTAVTNRPSPSKTTMGWNPYSVIMGIEQPQLLAAVHGVERVVDVEHDPLGNLSEGGAGEVDHRPP